MNKIKKTKRKNVMNIATYKQNQEIIKSMFDNTDVGYSIALICLSAYNSIKILKKDNADIKELYNLSICFASLIDSKDKLLTEYSKKNLNTIEYTTMLNYVNKFKIVAFKFIMSL